VKRIYTYLPLVLLLAWAPLARAQGSFDLALGFGTQHAKATGTGIDENTFEPCLPSSSDTTCQATPALGGLFMGFEGDAMLNKHIGFGGELNFQPSKGNYGPIQSRELFYDFNGLYAPINRKKVQFRIEAGVGGAHFGTSYTSSSCVGSAVCQSQTVSAGSSSHFQVHVGAGVQFYVKDHFFIRPQFDFREVPGLSGTYGSNSVYQYGSNQVIGFTVWVGYNFGEM
jgi:outer membrane protein with beta-barrel domain